MEWKQGDTPVHKWYKGLCSEYVFLQLHKCVFPLPSGLPSQGAEPHNLKFRYAGVQPKTSVAYLRFLGPYIKPGAWGSLVFKALRY